MSEKGHVLITRQSIAHGVKRVLPFVKKVTASSLSSPSSSSPSLSLPEQLLISSPTSNVTLSPEARSGVTLLDCDEWFVTIDDDIKGSTIAGMGKGKGGGGALEGVWVRRRKEEGGLVVSVGLRAEAVKLCKGSDFLVNLEGGGREFGVVKEGEGEGEGEGEKEKRVLHKVATYGDLSEHLRSLSIASSSFADSLSSPSFPSSPSPPTPSSCPRSPSFPSPDHILYHQVRGVLPSRSLPLSSLFPPLKEDKETERLGGEKWRVDLTHYRPFPLPSGELNRSKG